jgi:type VII secretion-associated serine protease mycosin
MKTNQEFTEGNQVFAGHRRLRLFALFLLTCMLLTPAVLAAAASVNDPLAPDQWGWHRVKADQAYDTGYHGEGVVVALLDTGVDAEHPDLAANIIDGWNFVDGNDNITDVDGHGTMVCGIIAAVANNGIGIAGVAPNVSIMPLKVLTESGGNMSSIDLAIRYAADHGAQVIGMSLGGNSVRFPFMMQAAVEYAYEKGCILVAAAGNDGSSDLFYPAAFDQVIAVSAIDENDQKASFSNYGNYIDFCAPGVNVLTTWPGGAYAYGNGTSFAAPFVTGVVALMLSKDPSLSPENVTASLRVEAEDLGAEGWDQFYGWGLVDAYAAVSLTPIPETSSVVFFTLIASATLMIAVLKKKRDPCEAIEEC